MKIVKEQLESFVHAYPASVAVVLVRSRDRINAMAAAWHTPISFRPPLYGVSIAPKRYSHNLIIEAKEWTLNFFSQEDIELIHKLGHTTGAQIDKFTEFKIETEPSVKIKSPTVKKAFAAYECQLYDYKTYGDHTLFVGTILVVHYQEEGFVSGKVMKAEALKPALYIGDDNYITVDAKSIVSTKEIPIHPVREQTANGA